jgi:hypothetical protein
MLSRKFAVGDRVQLSLDTPLNHNPQDVYTVSRILPAQANVWQYRVKRADDGQERAVGEPQLVKVTPEQRTGRNEIETQRDIQRIRNANSLERAHRAAKRR